VKNFLALSSCVVIGAAFGCAADGTKTGNGVQMEFVATGQSLVEADSGSSAPFAVTDLQGTTFWIDDAKLVVSEIELRAKGEDLCTFDTVDGITCTNGRIRIREVMELDLLAPRGNRVLQGLEFPAVVYDRVEVRTQTLDKDSLLGPVSFHVSGQVTFNGQTNVFVLSLKRNETLRFENLNGVAMADNEWLSAQIELRSWFATLPLTDCVEAGDVVLEQDTWMFTESSKCKQIEQLFVEELLKSTRLSKSQR
jgi:hypothetical protein